MSFTKQLKGRTKTWMSNPNISQRDFKLELEGKNQSHKHKRCQKNKITEN